ncbi:MAG: hypothetical protein AAFR79_12585 [Pseudomonadota bacterium]
MCVTALYAVGAETPFRRAAQPDGLAVPQWRSGGGRDHAHALEGLDLPKGRVVERFGAKAV